MVIDYSNEEEELFLKDIFEKESKRQCQTSRDDLENVKIKLTCKNCGEKFEKWLFDPMLKTVTCSEKCEIEKRKKDVFDENSSKLQHECVVCGLLFENDGIIVGKSREDAVVNRECLVCSPKCKETYGRIFG